MVPNSNVLQIEFDNVDNVVVCKTLCIQKQFNIVIWANLYHLFEILVMRLYSEFHKNSHKFNLNLISVVETDFSEFKEIL